MNSEMAARKKSLRQKMLARRRALSAESLSSWRAGLTAQLLSLPQYKQATRILAYLSLPGEADLDDFIQKALQDGKEVYIPVCLPDRQMEAGRLYEMGHFVKGPYGLRDLAPGYEVLEAEKLDLVLVPAVACDRMGHRLGHGAGYYDRYLPRVAREKRIAVLWSFQEADAIPADSFDQTMHGFVTEKEIYMVPQLDNDQLE